MKPLQLIPILSPTRLEPFDLTAVVLECISAAGETLQNGDILLISSKFAAIAEGRFVKLETVQPSDRARQVAAQCGIKPEVAELVLQESDHVFGVIEGFLLTVSDHIIAPNAGIDSSNVPADCVVLYPDRPFERAAQIRQIIQQKQGVVVGIILTDSRLIPGRMGTTGAAIGVAGFAPVIEEPTRSDLFGRAEIVTHRAVADDLTTAAEMLMGEAAEGVPIVIARNTGITMTGDQRYTGRDLATDWQPGIYEAIMGGDQL